MSQKPLTLSERARKLGEAAQLRYASARELLEELREVCEAAETYTDTDPLDQLEQLTAAVGALSGLSDLGIGLTPEQVAAAAECVGVLISLLPDVDDVRTLAAEIELLDQCLDEMEAHRDSPSNYDPEERTQAREDTRDALVNIADALDALDLRVNTEAMP